MSILFTLKSQTKLTIKKKRKSRNAKHNAGNMDPNRNLIGILNLAWPGFLLSCSHVMKCMHGVSSRVASNS